MQTTGHVLWQSILRTLVPVAVGAVIGWLASAGITADPQLETALGAALTAVGTAAYYVVVRVLEVHVSPHFGWLLGSTQSPDGYSVGAPPAGQADDDAPAPADAPQAQTRAERHARERGAVQVDALNHMGGH